jgi:2'-5' RNA ligase
MKRRDDGRVRLFVALLPPPEAVADLVTVTRALPAVGLRWVRPAQWHLTVAFLGEVDGRTCVDLVERLGRAARRHPPLTVSFGGAGRFGDHVLWADVHGDRVGLRRLAASVRAAARRCGLPTEERPYRPHLTLARGAGADLAPLVDRLHGFAGRPWTASDLHLIHSDLGAGPGGTARHEGVATWPLGIPRSGPA